MRKIIIEDGDGETIVEVAQHDGEEVRLCPRIAVKLGYMLVRQARQVCQHKRCMSHYDSDGPHDMCLECGVEIG